MGEERVMRKGAAAIAEAAERRGGGDFRPFVPQIQWRDDGDEKFIRFLTPLDEVPLFEYHDWIPVGEGEKADGSTYTKYEQFISRKDPYIGEDYDDIQDRLDVAPKPRLLGIAVELEPVMENVKGRSRPVGFEVKTTTFNRKDDEGNEEEVTAPAIGIVVQASSNFWGWLSSYDAGTGPIEETAFQVKRRGKKTDTAYDFIPLEGRPIDMSGLLENVDGVSYLSDDLDELLGALEQAADDDTAALIIAEAIFARRINELCDEERYESLVSPIEEIEQKFGPKKKKDEKPTVKRERPKRTRKKAEPETEEHEAAGEDPSEEDSPEEVETKTDKFAKLRAKMESAKA